MTAVPHSRDALLDALAEVIIPRAADGSRPGGSEVGFGAYLRDLGHQDWLEQGLAAVDAAAREQHGTGFEQLDAGARQALVESIKRKQFRFFGELANLLMLCYYQHERVLPAIGMEARAPFPLGYAPIDGDLGLLEPVYERGPIWRAC
jgi:hypothetical protein